MKLAKFLTCGFVVILYLYVWSVSYAYLEDLSQIYMLKPILVSSGVLALLAVTLMNLLVGVIGLALFRNRQLDLWETIFWPLISKDWHKDRLAKWEASYTIAEIDGSKNLNRLGGKLIKVFYMNSANYCQISIENGEMTVQTGPGVKLNHCSPHNYISRHKPLFVFLRRK